MRTGKWHRSDRLVNCMPRDLFSSQKQENITGTGMTDTGTGDVVSIAEAGLQEALTGLQEAGLLEVLSPHQHHFSDAWAALSACLLAPELKQLHLNITRGRAKG
jgi:hypothetical protein